MELCLWYLIGQSILHPLGFILLSLLPFGVLWGSLWDFSGFRFGTLWDHLGHPWSYMGDPFVNKSGLSGCRVVAKAVAPGARGRRRVDTVPTLLRHPDKTKSTPARLRAVAWVGATPWTTRRRRRGDAGRRCADTLLTQDRCTQPCRKVQDQAEKK